MSKTRRTVIGSHPARGIRNRKGVGSEFRRRRHLKDFVANEDSRILESMGLRHHDLFEKKNLRLRLRSIRRFLDAHVGLEWDFVYLKLRRSFGKNDPRLPTLLDTVTYYVPESPYVPYHHVYKYIIEDGVLRRGKLWEY